MNDFESGPPQGSSPDHAELQTLCERMILGAAMLDQTGADAPPAPDAGASTGLIGELLAGMSGAVGDLVTAVGVTAGYVRPPGRQSPDGTDQDSTRRPDASDM